MPAPYVTYFESASGAISIPPTLDTPTPPGYDRRECHSIHEVEALERRMQQSSRDTAELEGGRWEAEGMETRRPVHRNLMTAIEPSSTSPYDKEFLKAWCELRDEKRREPYKRIFQQRESYFEALHFDHPRNAEEVLKESL